jgi:DNA-binding FadR family transcriptional regulator
LDTGEFRIEPPTRQRVADHVFETLAKAILRGEIRAGDPLPTQRDLASRFNISALVVRQAIHRLEDLGLVRVRQGSATIVLDPAKATDIRLIQLQIEMADPGPALAAAAGENQTLFIVPLLVLAQRRITREELDVLEGLVDRLAKATTDDELRRCRSEYWATIAQATRNPLFQQQVRWWVSLMRGSDRRLAPVGSLSGPTLVDFYRRLVTALAAGKGAVELWLQVTEPVLKAFDRQLEKSQAKVGGKKSAAKSSAKQATKEP